MAGQRRKLLRVRGLGGKETDHEGMEIEGWVLAGWIDLL
jgi:hypothetical protein